MVPEFIVSKQRIPLSTLLSLTLSLYFLRQRELSNLRMMRIVMARHLRSSV